MSNETTPGLQVIWNDHRNFKDQVTKKFQSLDSEIQEMRAYLKQQDEKFDIKFQGFDDKFTASFAALDSKIDRKMEALNNSLTQVTTNAINAMPKWASESMDRKNLLITGLFTVVAAFAGGLITIISIHH
jgi:hypothetical protein